MPFKFIIIITIFFYLCYNRIVNAIYQPHDHLSTIENHPFSATSFVHETTVLKKS